MVWCVLTADAHLHGMPSCGPHGLIRLWLGFCTSDVGLAVVTITHDVFHCLAFIMRAHASISEATVDHYKIFIASCHEKRITSLMQMRCRSAKVILLFLNTSTSQ
jgi:hypothetical protein